MTREQRMATAIRPRPAVGSLRSWLSFLAGFAVLCAVLLGTSAVDATGRWGLAILAAVLLTAVVVERVRRPLVGSATSCAGWGWVGRVAARSRWPQRCRASSCWCSR